MQVLRLRPQNFIDKHCQKSAGAVPALNWNVNNRQFNVDRNNADNQNSNNGVRGGMRDYVLCVDLSQPPSIRPISANLAWIWKILVSFAKASSRIKRSFKVVISSLALAFIK